MGAEVDDQTLGDYFALQRGTTYKSSLLGSPGPVLLGLATIERNGGFRSDSLKTYGGDSPERLLVHAGELYLSLKDVTQSADLLGAVARLPPEHAPGRLTQDTVKLEPKSADTPLDYLYWLLRTPQYRAYCRSHATGTTNLGLARDDFLAFPAPAPTAAQNRIVETLSTLDDKIELNRRRNQTLEAMARALFKDWFIDFGPVRRNAALAQNQPSPGLRPPSPRGRGFENTAHEPLPSPPGRGAGGEGVIEGQTFDHLFPDRLDDEGKPEGWEMVPASELIEFNPSEPLRKGAPAPYLDMGSLPTSGSWPEPPVMRDFGSGMRFRNGDTLLARITPCLENGKTAFVQCLPDDTVGWGSTEYIVMRAKAPVPAEYAYLLARDGAFREHAIRSMTGTSGRQRAQGESVAASKLASPPEKVWYAFAKQVTPIFESIRSHATASETLAGLRDTLLPNLISGELRIAGAEKYIEHIELQTSKNNTRRAP